MHKPILLLSILFIVCQRRVCQRRDYLTSIVKLILQKNSNLDDCNAMSVMPSMPCSMMSEIQIRDTSTATLRLAQMSPSLRSLRSPMSARVLTFTLILHILCKLRWQFLSRNFQFNTYNICKRKVQIINNTINKD